jgi:hypothetical protein
MPGYQKLLDQYGPQGFVVIGFKFDTMQDTDDPVRFAREIGVHYPLAVASGDLKLKFGGIDGLPTTMLYYRHGIRRKEVIGFEYTSTSERASMPTFLRMKGIGDLDIRQEYFSCCLLTAKPLIEPPLD